MGWVTPVPGARIVGISNYGGAYSQWMAAETVAANISGATELWTSATGCSGFEIQVFDGMTGGTDWLVAGWDSVASGTTIVTALASIISTGPAGTADGTAVANTAGIMQPSQTLRVVAHDEPIRAIAAVGNAAHKYLLTIYA